MLKIYGRPDSINVRKVLWLISELGLAFEREDWGRGYRPVSEAEFLALNPFAMVPVIDDDGLLLRESHAILRYLAAKHGRFDLYPRALERRAEVDMWLDWAGIELSNVMRPVFLGGLVKSPRYDFPGLIAESIASWNQMMQVLDGLLSGRGGYLLGEDFTLADVAVGVYVHRWLSLDFEKPDLACISSYYALLSKHCGYQTYLLTGKP